MTLYVVLCGDWCDTTELSEIGGIFTSRSAAETAISDIRRKQAEHDEFRSRLFAKENAHLNELKQAGKWTGWWGDFPEHKAMYDAMEGRKHYPGRPVMEIVEVGSPDVWVLKDYDDGRP